ncbi:COX15/CtaA family protein [Asticcacaulis sp. SL142]|uniref:COX15/CtaA family protein n=1 Tax=Asticcacaulis sp. SL142 TaxID=2995155 RepID=UPI00226CADC1|nr:COX15/CtaA family protein [Asticcacaulis sp. SL142]WAC49003.1 COX15/CtaA family protein [Asticcacaulis sp. SL142]
MRLPLKSPLVAAWLFAVAFLVVAMILVGGATRLTDSGLSITEWKPVTGAIPPLDDAAWQQEFEKYQKIPEYSQINAHMDLEDFKGIYWWEWIHRFLGRLIGVVFFVPFVILLLRSEVPGRLIWRCAGLLGLGALQGGIGWWMVSSGLDKRVDVAPERLMIHLGMALLILVLTLWTACEALAGQGRGRGAPQGWRVATSLVFGVIILQCLLGALVAGNDAGTVYNDWPLMNGHIAPYVDWSKGIGFVFFHDQGMVQFMHRIVAYIALIGITTYAIILVQKCMDDEIRLISTSVATLAWIQGILGVATLVTGAQIGFGLMHQFVAVCLIILATLLMWKVARADRDFRLR